MKHKENVLAAYIIIIAISVNSPSCFYYSNEHEPEQEIRYFVPLLRNLSGSMNWFYYSNGLLCNLYSFYHTVWQSWQLALVHLPKIRASHILLKATLLNLRSSYPVNVLYFSEVNNFHTTAECIYKNNLLRMRTHWIEYQKIYSYSCMLCITDAEVAIFLSSRVSFILTLSWPKMQWFVLLFFQLISKTNEVLSSSRVFCSSNDDNML